MKGKAEVCDAESDMADRSVPGTRVRVRPYAPPDREAVLALASRLTIGVAPWLDAAAMLVAAKDGLGRMLDRLRPDQAVLVTQADDGRVVGFVSVERQVAWAGGVQAYVGELVVAEAAEGRGVGRALLGAVEAWARDQDCRMVALDTGATNVRAREFYRRLGFGEESIKLVKVLG